jgi:hypothetical protein
MMMVRVVVSDEHNRTKAYLSRIEAVKPTVSLTASSQAGPFGLIECRTT